MQSRSVDDPGSLRPGHPADGLTRRLKHDGPHRILVTGASGLIGSAIVAAISELGSEPIPMSRRGPGERCDIRDRSALRATLQRHRPDAVVHTAYLLADRTPVEPRAAIEVNLTGFLNVVEESLAADVSDFVNVSSIAVYDGRESSDKASTAPKTTYGSMKLLNEQMMANCEGFVRDCSVRIVNAYDNTEGHGQTGWLSAAVRRALLGESVAIDLAPAASMSIAWAHDIGERLAALACCPSGALWPSVVDGGGQGVTGADLESTFREFGARAVTLGADHYDYPSRVPSPWLDKLVNRPAIPLAEALQRMSASRLSEKGAFG